MIRVVFESGANDVLAPSTRDLISALSATTELEIRTHLPLLADNVELHVDARGGWEIIPQFGCGATSVAEDRINFIVDPSHGDDPEQIVRAHLRHLLFHECHHLVRGWFIGGAGADRFIHGVVCEGLATAFERDASAVTPPWAEYPENVREWVEELLPLPATAPYAQWMFFHPDGRLWIGYRAGTYLADLAMRACGSTAAELARTETREILELAGFDPL